MKARKLKTIIVMAAVIGLGFLTTACSDSSKSNIRGCVTNCSGSGSGSGNSNTIKYSDLYKSGLGESFEAQLALEFYSEDQRSDNTIGSISAEGTLYINSNSVWADCEIFSGDYEISTDSAGHVDGAQTIRGVRATGRSGSDYIELTIDYAMFTSPQGGNILSCEREEFSYAMLSQISITSSNGRSCNGYYGIDKKYLFSFNGYSQFSCGN